MKEAYGNIWSMLDADAICITTNGTIKVNGEAVMGKGIAKELVDRYPKFPATFGKRLSQEGNKLHVFWSQIRNYYDGYDLSQDVVTFPTKHNWWEMSDMELIRKSCNELMEWAEECPHWKKIVLPRPGVGNGRLKWDDVKKEIEKILDNRIYVVTFCKS